VRRLVVVLLFAAGCAPPANVTSMVIRHNAKAGTWELSSGKNVKAASIHAQIGNAVLDVRGYDSQADASVIQAEDVRETNRINAITNAVVRGMEAGGAVAGTVAGHAAQSAVTP